MTGAEVGPVEVLTFRAGYNTGVVMAGAAALGAAAGGVGAFLLLRARAMAADAVGHATLPGIVLAFVAAGLLGADGRSLPVLLAGAAATGMLGMAAAEALTRSTRLAPDAAIAIALSVSYAIGIVLLSWVQTLPQGSQGGLESFILGQAAALSASEAVGLGVAALAALAVLLALFRPFGLLCFDEDHARARGWPVARLDAALLALGVLVTVLGLQTVGLVLVVALLILPAVAARFWSERLKGIFWLSVAFGAGGAFLGADSRGALVLGRLPRAPAGVEDLHDGHAVEDIRRRRDGPPRHPRGPRVRPALRRGRRLRPVHRAGGRGRTGLGCAAARRRPGASPAAGGGGPQASRRVRPGAAGGAVPPDHRGRGAGSWAG